MSSKQLSSLPHCSCALSGSSARPTIVRKRYLNPLSSSSSTLGGNPALWAASRHFFVRFRETPNELCYRFEVEGATFLSVDSSSASLSFTRENQHHSPLAAQLLSALPMVEEVTVGSGFVTVRKVPDGDAEAVSEGARSFVEHFEKVHGAAIREEEKQMREVAAAQHQQHQQHQQQEHQQPLEDEPSPPPPPPPSAFSSSSPPCPPPPPNQAVEEEKLEEGTIAELIASSTWEDLKMHVSALLTDHMYSGEPHIALDAPHPHSDTLPAEGDSEVVLAIKELVRTAIRPLLQEDGGDIRFDGFTAETGEMRVELLGACRRCPSSRNTLQDVIERTTQHWIPEVLRVVPIETPLPSTRSRNHNLNNLNNDAVEGSEGDDLQADGGAVGGSGTEDEEEKQAVSPASNSGSGACAKIEESAHAHLVRRTTGSASA